MERNQRNFHGARDPSLPTVPAVSQPEPGVADGDEWIGHGELPNERGFDYRRLRSALARQAPRIPLLLRLSSFVAATERGPAHAMSDPVPGRSLRK
jgi:hypothetical protein